MRIAQLGLVLALSVTDWVKSTIITPGSTMLHYRALAAWFPLGHQPTTANKKEMLRLEGSHPQSRESPLGNSMRSYLAKDEECCKVWMWPERFALPQRCRDHDVKLGGPGTATRRLAKRHDEDAGPSPPGKPWPQPLKAPHKGHFGVLRQAIAPAGGGRDPPTPPALK